MKNALDRLKEPSSWAAIAAIIGIVAPNIVAGETWDLITQVGTGAAALLAIALREKTIS